MSVFSVSAVYALCACLCIFLCVIVCVHVSVCVRVSVSTCFSYVEVREQSLMSVFVFQFVLGDVSFIITIRLIFMSYTFTTFI